MFTECLAHAGPFTSSVDDKKMFTHRRFLEQLTVQEETQANDYDADVPASRRRLESALMLQELLWRPRNSKTHEDVDFVVTHSTFPVPTLTPICWMILDNLRNFPERFSPLVMVSFMRRCGYAIISVYSVNH